jgi:pimeloyl-ACP methyl ester carboxylesterase
MGSLREVRTLTRRLLAFLNADPRQQLPRGTVAPLRGRDRMLLRLVPVFLPYEFVIDGNMTSVEYAEKLRNVHVPTLVIAGEHDARSLGMSREMNDRIAGSRLAILPRSKHMTFVDQTEMFNRAVDEFVHTNRPVVP